jgi:hypothetical protein
MNKKFTAWGISWDCESNINAFHGNDVKNLYRIPDGEGKAVAVITEQEAIAAVVCFPRKG